MEFLPGSGSVSATLWIVDVGYVYTNRKEAGWMSTLGDTPTNREEEKKEGVRELVLPSTGY